MNSVLHAARRVQWVRWILRRIRRTMRLGVSCLMHERCMNSVLHAARRFQWVRWICVGSRFQVRLGVSSLLPHLAEASSVIGFTCGSASIGRRLSMDSDAARRLQFVTTSRLGIVCHWICMRLGVAWALSVNGFRCGSASLGRCLSPNLDAARRRCGDGF